MLSNICDYCDISTIVTNQYWVILANYILGLLSFTIILKCEGQSCVENAENVHYRLGIPINGVCGEKIIQKILLQLDFDFDFYQTLSRNWHFRSYISNRPYSSLAL